MSEHARLRRWDGWIAGLFTLHLAHALLKCNLVSVNGRSAVL
jgi:hypothetical protein